MASTIKLKNGSGAPTSGQLVQGEPAFDLTNKRLYTENASGTVIEVGTNPSSLTTASADINGGTIDGTVIGGSSPAAGTFTSITGTSANINGTVTVDDLAVENPSAANIYLDGTGTGRARVHSTYGILNLTADADSNTAGTSIKFKSGTTDRMLIDSDTGDISFYEDTGTTAKFFWDASAESLGIGTSSPSYPLHVRSSGTGTTFASNIVSRLETNGSGYSSTLQFSNNVDASATVGLVGSALGFGIGTSEKMRIDSSGRVGIGTASPDRLLHLEGTDNAIIRLTNVDTSLVADQLIGGVEFEKLDASGAGAGVVGGVRMHSEGGVGESAYLKFSTASSSTNDVERMRISSAGNVGIGTSSAAETLVLNKAANNNLIRFDIAGAAKGYLGTSSLNNGVLTGSTAGDINLRSEAGLNFGAGGSSNIDMRITSAGYVGIGTTPSFLAGNGLHIYQASGTSVRVQDATTDFDILSFGTNVNFTNRSNGALIFATNGSERARIDSNGVFSVANTTTAYGLRVSSTLTGMSYTPTDYLTVAADGVCHYANRIGSDGDIAVFNKDGTTVGSIGANSGTPYMSGNLGGFRLTSSGGAGVIIPTDTTGAASDADNDLGVSSARWRNLYLSGGVYLGGTGAANHLDDYEEGSWTPSVIGSTTAGTATYNLVKGGYVKIGKIVHVVFWINLSTHTGTGNLQITGLPFTTSNFAGHYPAVTLTAVSGLTKPANHVLSAYAATNSTTINIVSSDSTSTVQTFAGLAIDSSFSMAGALTYEV